MPSADSISFIRLSAAAATTLFPSSASAALQEDPSAVLEPAQEAALPPEPAPQVLPEVHVTVVGGALSAAALELALGPGLESAYTLHYSSADRFIAENLFRVPAESQASIHVWVDTNTPRTARLYFANREGTRYLMRTLELSEPLDEMDREALAQAIEWSLQALADRSAGLTRAEAEALLSTPSEPSSPPPPKEHSRAGEQAADPWRRRTGWLPEVALLHRWAPLSAELPATQGPVLQVGFDRVTAHHQFGFAVSAQYQYPQRYAETGVALQLQSVASRIDARYLATGLIDGSGIGLRFGFGFDAVFSSHEALDWTRFEATENRLSGVPLITGGIVWQLRVSPTVRLDLSVGAEIDLINVHYDVVATEGTTNLLSRWPARPSASVGVALF